MASTRSTTFWLGERTKHLYKCTHTHIRDTVDRDDESSRHAGRGAFATGAARSPHRDWTPRRGWSTSDSKHPHREHAQSKSTRARRLPACARRQYQELLGSRDRRECLRPLVSPSRVSVSCLLKRGQGLIRSAVSYAFARNVDVKNFQADTGTNVVVTRSDFELALEEIKPAFGVSGDALSSQSCVCVTHKWVVSAEHILNGIIDFSPAEERLRTDLTTLTKQVKDSASSPIISVLLWGQSGVLLCVSLRISWLKGLARPQWLRIQLKQVNSHLSKSSLPTITLAIA